MSEDHVSTPFTQLEGNLQISSGHPGTRSLNQDSSDDTLIVDPGATSSCYLAPLPKSDWQIDTDKLGDICEDVANYMFQYMTPESLVKIGSVNRRLREYSSKDEIWMPIYNNFTKYEGLKRNGLLTKDFKEAFIEKAKEKRTRAERREKALKELPHFKINQSCLQISYGMIAPQFFMFSFLVFLILVPLLMDDIISMSMVGYCCLPLFFSLGTYLFMSISTIADPYFFHLKKRKLLDNIPEMNVSKDYSLNAYDEYSINLFVWHLWIWLIFILMFVTKYIWFASLSAPFSALFIPCYVFYIVYCIIPPIIYYKKREDIKFDGKVTFSFSYITNGIIISGSALQILLIGLKLDGVITTYWNVVLIPAWLFLIHINCIMGCSFCACGALTSSTFKFCYNILGVLICLPFVFCYQVWFIIFALRLDYIFSAQFTPLFVPLWIFMIVAILLHLCVAGGTFYYVIFKYDKEYEIL